MREKEIDYCRGKHNVLVSIYLFPLLLFLSPCCVNTGEDSASNRHSECEVDCYKNWVDSGVSCLNSYLDCVEEGENEADWLECYNELNSCREEAYNKVTKCSEACSTECLKDYLDCLDNCNGDEDCEKDCWTSFCECTNWGNCECARRCNEKFEDCLNADPQDMQHWRDCIDEWKKCNYTCIQQ